MHITNECKNKSLKVLKGKNMKDKLIVKKLEKIEEGIQKIIFNAINKKFQTNHYEIHLLATCNKRYIYQCFVKDFNVKSGTSNRYDLEIKGIEFLIVQLNILEVWDYIESLKFTRGLSKNDNMLYVSFYGRGDVNITTLMRELFLTQDSLVMQSKLSKPLFSTIYKLQI